jgi:hypothetical protein
MINCKIVKSDDDSNGFPKLMRGSEGSIVLMDSQAFGEGSGMVIAVDADGCPPIGFYSSKWNMDNFKDFKGSIELSNK